MTKVILNVQSSPMVASSASRATSKIFIDKYVASNPGTRVVDLDLAANPPGHIGADHFGIFFGLPDDHGPAALAALAESDKYVAQLIAADVIVLGTPMHNLGIASVLKAWVDNVVRAGRTFKFTETGTVEGLLTGKSLVIVLGSGGIYSDGPMQPFDHAATYLQAIFGFMGITNTKIIRAEGLALGPAVATQGMANAASAAEQAVLTL